MEAFMPQLLRTMDQLDPMLTEAEDRRVRLIATASQLCAEQHLPVTDTQVAQAVDQTLSITPLPAMPPQKSNHDFGWDRPRTQAQRESFFAKAQTRWGRLIRWCVEIPADPVPTLSVGGLIFGSLSWGGISLLSLFMRNLFAFVSGGMLAAITTVIVLIFLKHRGDALKKLDGHLEEKMNIADDHIVRWQKLPQTREYVCQCLLSDLPVLLVGDVKRLGEIIQESESRKEEDARAVIKVEQLTRLKKAFLVETGAVDL
jgi:hypothetical protein